MIAINGTWYDGKSSNQKKVALQADGAGTVRIVETLDGVVLGHCNFTAIQVSDRLARTPRYLTFPDGSVFATEDNPAVDQLLNNPGSYRWSHLIHRMESKKRHAIVALVLILMIGAALVKYGFPLAAKMISAHLPHDFFEMADRQTLDVLDKMFFSPSLLPAHVDDRVRRHLQNAIDAHENLQVQLIFRQGGRLGPNAFALPGGTIVFTDELIAIAAHDDELLAIMSHEIGHVYHRHGMRRMVQSSLLAFAILALTGDASGVSEIFLGFPVILTELAYSREFERDADRHALVFLQSRDINPDRFADILERLEAHGSQTPTREDQNHKKIKWSGYLATHPPTPDRVKRFRQAGESR